MLLLNPTNNSSNHRKDTNCNTINRSYSTVPYMKALSESIKNICKRYGIQVNFRGGKTIKDLLVAPKDKEHITKKWHYLLIQMWQVGMQWRVNRRVSKDIWREVQRTSEGPYPIYDHNNITDHITTLENFSIVGREGGSEPIGWLKNQCT